MLTNENVDYLSLEDLVGAIVIAMFNSLVGLHSIQ